MAKAARNILVRGIRGSLGNFVFRQMRDGSTWISVTPDFRHRKFSKEQKDHQSRFKEAAAYARHASKIHPIYSKLTKGTTKMPTILRFQTGSTHRWFITSSGKMGGSAWTRAIT